MSDNINEFDWEKNECIVSEFFITNNRGNPLIFKVLIPLSVPILTKCIRNLKYNRDIVQI